VPFELRPISLSSQGNEVTLRCHILSGAYFGPEAVLLRDANGRELESQIHGHGIESPIDWPVLPEHKDTVIVLYLPKLPDDFRPTLVTGLGSLQLADKRADISGVIAQPEFWALQADLHFAGDFDDPGLELFGVDFERRNAWHEAKVSGPQEQGVWPYIRVSLPGSKYIEWEMAAGAETQDRIWIGHKSGSSRVLLGYHSCHFSLPALRLAEVLWLADTSDSRATLLWLTATYFEQEDAYPSSLAESLFHQLPGTRSEKAQVASNALRENLVVPDLRWSLDPARGWQNNSPYSQRNPESHLSILTQADFAYIHGFFT
jgi:hypothetical protein